MRHGEEATVFCTLAILAIASVMDLRSWKISNWLILSGMAAGALIHIFTESSQSVADYGLGTVLPVLLFWILFRMHALGAGDIKLFSVIGCVNGCKDLCFTIIFSFLIASGISLSRLLSQRLFIRSLKEIFQYFQQTINGKKIRPYPGSSEQARRIHFSVAVLLGFLANVGVELCGITI